MLYHIWVQNIGRVALRPSFTILLQYVIHCWQDLSVIKTKSVVQALTTPGPHKPISVTVNLILLLLLSGLVQQH